MLPDGFFLQFSRLGMRLDDTIMRFIFQLVFLHLQLQSFSSSASPRIQACDTRPPPLVGGVWERDYTLSWVYIIITTQSVHGQWLLRCTDHPGMHCLAKFVPCKEMSKAYLNVQGRV